MLSRVREKINRFLCNTHPPDQMNRNSISCGQVEEGFADPISKKGGPKDRLSGS